MEKKVKTPVNGKTSITARRIAVKKSKAIKGITIDQLRKHLERSKNLNIEFAEGW
jgi:hypothetical protein